MPVLDVRSPGEFQSGHIPGAVNVPLFTDQQRAEVGTIYTRIGREPAILKGLELIGPRLAGLVRQAMDHAKDCEVLVHCWRGGMRSNSFAKILEMADLRPTVLAGGYKAFRQMARASFEQELRFIVVSGLTGAGKTSVLHRLKSAGEQVIDLEELANHRGSSFGGIGQHPQPMTEQFENNLFQQIDRLDLDRNIWVEDEGNRIGAVVVPDVIYRRIQLSPAVTIECSFEQRVDNLMVDYGDHVQQQLIGGIERIAKRLGGLATKQAITAVESGDIRAAIEICLAYYDKTYRTAMSKMPRQRNVCLAVDQLSPDELVSRLTEIASQIRDQWTE